jgi:prolyl-tRNA synthetase
MAGVYNYLPLGLKVLRKIEQVIREEIDAIGGQEVWLAGLSAKESWEKTGRWNTVDVLFKLPAANNREYALNPTHEEVITPLMQEFTRSYKQLPACVYQFQTKFRNEKRAKSGLMRGREFFMKDAYSFHTTQESLDEYYEQMRETYLRIFTRLGIGEKTHYVYASGGAFCKYSHEFQLAIEIGEDLVFQDPETGVCYNKEIVISKVSPFEYASSEEPLEKHIEK